MFPGFQPSTVGSSRLRFFSWSHWSTLIPHPKLSHSFNVIFSERCRLILATPCHLSALGWDRYWRSGHSLQPGSTDFRNWPRFRLWEGNRKNQKVLPWVLGWGIWNYGLQRQPFFMKFENDSVAIGFPHFFGLKTFWFLRFGKIRQLQRVSWLAICLSYCWWLKSQTTTWDVKTP